MKVERTGKMKGIAVSGSVGVVFAVVGLFGPVGAQDASTDGKLAKYKREHRTFTSKQGHDYKTAGIQKVTATDVSVITDEGVVRIKTADMPDDFRKIFGLNMAKIQEAQVAYARKKYDSKKAAIRKKAAQKAVQAMKARLTLKVVEEVEFGAICDAQFIEEVAQTVKTTVKARGLSRDQEAKTKYVDVKKAQPVGFPEKMLVRGLPKSLRAGSPWEGDVYMVGTYLLDLEARKPGDNAPPALDVPMAIVGFNDAVEYRAATLPDGSQGSVTGTGVAIGKDGYILTTFKLVKNTDSIMVTIPGRDQALKAKIVAKDEEDNLAVLKVQSLLKPVPLSLAPSVKLGQEVFTIGYPDVDIKSREVKLTEGNVAALKGVQDDSRYFQVEGDFQSGNFGGAIFDTKGTVIGIVTPNPPESFFLDTDGTNYEPLQYVTKGTRFKTLLGKVSGFKPETAVPADPKDAAHAAAVLVAVKRSRR